MPTRRGRRRGNARTGGTQAPANTAPKGGGSKGGGGAAAKPYDPHGRTPFDPLRSAYPTWGAFNKAVTQRARGLVKPDLNAINEAVRGATGEYKGREGELQQWYGYEGQRALDASSKANEALNSLLTQQAGLQNAGTSGFAAALRAAGATEQAEAAKLGAQPQDLGEAGRLGTAELGRRAEQMGLGSQIGSSLVSAANQVGITGTAGREASTKNRQTYDAQLRELRNQRQDVRGKLPGLLQQTRSELMNEELGKQGQRYQQQLGNKQFGLSVRQQGFQEELGRGQLAETKRAAKAREKLDWANVGISQGQLDVAKGQLKLGYDQLAEDARQANLSAATTGATAKDKADADALDRDAKKFEAAGAWLDGYMKPGDSDKGPKGHLRPDKWRKNRTYGEAWTVLINRFGMSKLGAAQVLRSAPIPEWRKKAKYAIAVERNRIFRAKHPGSGMENYPDNPLGPH